MAATAGLGPVEVESLVLNGSALRGDITGAVSDVQLVRTTDGASTVTISATDPKRTLLNSPLIARRSTLGLDGLSFDLVKVAKSADQLSLTFESSTVAALRQNLAKTPAAAARTTDRYGYVRRVLAGTGVAVHTPTSGAKTQQVLAQGTAQTPAEDKWACLTRLASDVQDRCFEAGGELWFGPDSWLLAQSGAPTFRENTAGVDNIDFDFDIGKPLSTATLTVVASGWALPPGRPVVLAGVGPASYRWLVTTISKSIYTASASVTASIAQPSLPEPTATGA